MHTGGFAVINVGALRVGCHACLRLGCHACLDQALIDPVELAV